MMKSTVATATRGNSGLYPSDQFVMSESRESMEPVQLPPPAYTARDNNSRSVNTMENWPLHDHIAGILAPRLDSSKRRYPTLSALYDDSVIVFAVTALHVLAASITAITAIPAIELYANERNQLQGSGNRGYGIGGSVLALLSAGVSILMIVYIKADNGGFTRFILVCVYALSSALLGYSTYLVRNDKYCDPRYAPNGECLSVRVSTGWRCGIVAVAMSGLIAFFEAIGFFCMVVKYANGRFRSRRNSENSPV